jgi:hypothetical protein
MMCITWMRNVERNPTGYSIDDAPILGLLVRVPAGLAGLFSLETSQIPSALSHRARRRHAVYDGGRVDGNGPPRFGSLSRELQGTDFIWFGRLMLPQHVATDTFASAISIKLLRLTDASESLRPLRFPTHCEV